MSKRNNSSNSVSNQKITIEYLLNTQSLTQGIKNHFASNIKPKLKDDNNSHKLDRKIPFFTSIEPNKHQQVGTDLNQN